MFFKHLELELLEIMLPAHFLGFSHWFWLGYFCPFFPPLAVSRTSVRAGLTKLQECLKASESFPFFTLRQFFWVFSAGHFFSFGGRSPNKYSDKFHLTLSCPCRRAELLWPWNYRKEARLWCSGKGTWSRTAKDTFPSCSSVLS